MDPGSDLDEHTLASKKKNLETLRPGTYLFIMAASCRFPLKLKQRVCMRQYELYH